MKETKFRGKSHDNEGKIEGEWIYGFLAAPDQIMVWNEDNATGEMLQVIPETVGQFTGLHDSKGKEIYEGDIVKHTDGVNVVVEWCEQEVGWRLYHGFLYKAIKGISNTWYFENLNWEGLEVIGNIHENPELLKEPPNA